MLSLLTDILYTLTIIFIRIIKRIEFLILLPFNPFIEYFIKDIGEQVGVIFHKSNSFQNWTKEDEHRILQRCPYNKVIHLKVNSNHLFLKMVNNFMYGFGQGFMDKEWELLSPLEDLHEVVCRAIANKTCLKLVFNPWEKFINYLEFGLFNTQKRILMLSTVSQHYNFGNDLYTKFLDPWMQYSNGYWGRGATNVDEAQLHKIQLIAEKLNLKPGMRVLDVGCGWAMLAKYLAENYGVECVGLTISKEQAAFGKKACKGLPVDVRLQDYREVDGIFDRIVSVEMIEHVGHYNLENFFKLAHRCLKEDGLLLIQFSCMSQGKVTPFRFHRWLHNYVLPHANLPYLWEMSEKAEKYFRVEDFHNVSAGYDRIFLEWCRRLVKHENEIVGKYGESFFRMFYMYLAMSSGIMEAGVGQNWQIVYSKEGNSHRYKAVR